MRSIMSNIFNLIENFINIINNKCCLMMSAKYHNSSMNDACTIYLADNVSLPAKVIQHTTFITETFNTITTIINSDIVRSYDIYQYYFYGSLTQHLLIFKMITTIIYHNN